MSVVTKYGELLDSYLAFQEKNLPLWLSTTIQTVIFILIGFFLGALIHPILLLFFTVFPFYFTYIGLIKNQEYWRGFNLSIIWTITISITIIILTILFPKLAAMSILGGEAYKNETFLWISTGVGSTGVPSQFIPILITQFIIFCIACLISMSWLGIIFGAYMINYMNYYVGMLFLSVKEPTVLNYLIVATFGWQIWAISRVIGYLFLGLSLSIPLTVILFKQKMPWNIFKKYALIGLVFILLDIVLKIILAPFYQQILHSVITI